MQNWMRHLRTLRRAFENASVGGPLSCMIIHVTDSHRDRLSGPPQLQSMGARIFTARSGCYGLWKPKLDRDGAEIKPGDLDESDPWCRIYTSVDGHSNIVGVMPTLRRVAYWGDLSRQPTFSSLCADASKCVLGLPPQVLDQFSEESISPISPDERWLWILFDLAWQQRPQSPLQTKRMIWNRYSTGPYDRSHFQRLSEMGVLHSDFPGEWAHRLPGFYFSELSDVFHASSYAIDMLIADAESVTNGDHDKTPPKTPDAAELGSQKRKSRRGRKMVSDPKEDARIAEAWASGSYEKHADLAQGLGLPERDVKRALDRDRKRK